MPVTNDREARATLAATLMRTCIAAVALVGATAIAAHASADAQQPAATQPASKSVATQPAAAQPAAPANSSAPASAAQDSADRIIAVARDVSPEWAASLEKVRERDPSGFERATGVLAKRLKALAVLKERKPQLYALRVEELRIQGEVTALADQWRSAISTGRTEDASGIEKDLRAKVGAMVDLNLRSRAMELAELDEVMRSMRGDLERDARARDTTVAEALEAYRRGEEPAIGRSPVGVTPPVGASGAAEAAPSAAPSKTSGQAAPASANPAGAAPEPNAPRSGAAAQKTPSPAQGTP